MALPTIEKTWQYDVNRQTGLLGSYVTNYQETLWRISDILLNFASNPWTCIASSDSVSFAHDGTNYWVDRNDLIWAAANHSWIVLQQAAINTKFQVCFDLNHNSEYYGTVVVSPVAGFGVANGGTDGTLAARPTATDEIVLHNAATWFTKGTNDYSHHLHIMQSEDGECTRFFFGGTNFINQWALFDKPKNPVAGWSDPAVFLFDEVNFGNTDVCKYTYLNDAARAKAKIGAVTTAFYFATIGVINEMIGEDNNGPNDVEGGFDLTPIWLYTVTGGVRGTHGALYDLWFGGTRKIVGNHYPANGDRTHMHVGHLVHPWDGSALIAS